MQHVLKMNFYGCFLEKVKICTWITKICMVVPNICGSSVWNLLCVTLLAPIILKWLLDIWKIY